MGPHNLSLLSGNVGFVRFIGPWGLTIYLFLMEMQVLLGSCMGPPRLPLL